MARNIRTAAIALTALASVGGGIGVSHAAGIGPGAAASYDIKAASWYADNAVRAWGSGNTATASRYLTSGTQRALFGWRHTGGNGWARTGTSTGAGTTYVHYTERGTGATLTLTIKNSARTRTNRVINYVRWTEGHRTTKPRTNPPASTAVTAHVSTTALIPRM